MAETYKEVCESSPTIGGIKGNLEELGRMAHSPDINERRSAVVHPMADESILSVLAKDDDWVVRFCVPSHVNCTLDILFSMRKDPFSYTRCKVFSSLKASPKLLEVGANDVNPEVRACVANHPYTSLETLAHLKRDKDPLISQAARDRVNQRFQKFNDRKL